MSAPALDTLEVGVRVLRLLERAGLWTIAAVQAANNYTLEAAGLDARDRRAVREALALYERDQWGLVVFLDAFTGAQAPSATPVRPRWSHHTGPIRAVGCELYPTLADAIARAESAYCEGVTPCEPPIPSDAVRVLVYSRAGVVLDQALNGWGGGGG